MMAPEGVLLSWLTPDGAQVLEGDCIAEVMVEGARHALPAPASGVLCQYVEPPYVFEPDAVIGRIV